MASSTRERETLLEHSTELEDLYRRTALRGYTTPPSPEEEIDLHYVCFIKAPNGCVYEMDGDANGPVKTGIELRDQQDLLEASALECVKHCINRNKEDVNFSLLALVHKY